MTHLLNEGPNHAGNHVQADYRNPTVDPKVGEPTVNRNPMGINQPDIEKPSDKKE